MVSVNGFCDLNVNEGTHKYSLRDSCLRLMQYGYKTVAINQFLDGKNISEVTSNKKKGDKGFSKQISKDLVPPPIPLDVHEFQGKLQIIHRITIEFSDSLELNLLGKSINLTKYNLVALIPSTTMGLQYICGATCTFDFDIISFKSFEKNKLMLKRALYNTALEKNIFFELPYGPAVVDSTCRKNIITMAHIYHAFGKSRNVFLSSNGSEPMHIRGPYDVINLGLIYGLSEEQAKTALTTVCRNVCIRGETRRHGKAVMLVRQVAPSSPASGDEDDDEVIEPVPKKQKLNT